MMFGRTTKHIFPDLSLRIRDVEDWDTGILRAINYTIDAVVIAFHPLASLLAVGTSTGVVRVFGAPGVDLTLNPPEPLRIQFLQFSTSTGQLICVDERNQLHIWDLNEAGSPHPQKTVVFECAIKQRSLTFPFAYAREVKSYDLLCLKKSPYTIPNLWRTHCQQIAQAGMEIPSTPESDIPMDILCHPRDLNLMFVVFGGGVLLWDLTKRDITCAYELIIPAGAPGGSGYEAHGILTHRRPSATSIAVHPAGHYFAVGYTDGCIAFWAIEDGDRPLLVRTLKDVDVDIVDGLKIQQHLDDPSGTAQSSGTTPEAIYKLAWCGFPNSADPRGGETALLILGGVLIGDDPGLTLHLMPAFDSPSPPADASGLHPTVRNAMKKSLLPRKTAFYPSSSVVRDFSVVPRDSPHFSGTWDPAAVVWISGSSDTPAVEAYKFPPPNFFDGDPPSTPDPSGSAADMDDYLSAVLEEMKLGPDPQHLHLPSPLTNSRDGVTRALLMAIPRETGDKILTALVRQDSLVLNGGCAWIDGTKLSQAKLVKYQAPQIVVTTHRNGSIQFQDISPQLLISSEASPMTKDFPQPLHDLSINVNNIFADPGLGDMPQDTPEIISVQFAPESLECLVVLKTGVVFYRLHSGEAEDTTTREASDKEIILFKNPSTLNGNKFRPHLMLRQGSSPASSSSLCDIGFFAVGYDDGSIAVVDLRGPSVLSLPQDDRKRHFQLGHRHDPDRVVSLAWTVSGLAADLDVAIRLIAIHASGTTNIYKIARKQGSKAYSIAGVVTAETLPDTLPHCSYVIDANNGAPLHADGIRLAASMQSSTAKAKANDCLWVTVSPTGARCNVDITGDRIGKADWNRKHAILDGQIVERNGSHALVAFTEKNEVMVYSLPHLEFLHTIPLSVKLERPISVDGSGDFVYCERVSGTSVAKKLTLATIYKSRRVYDEPLTDLMRSVTPLPPQPQPVSVGPPSLLGSWFSPPKSLTGEQLDTLLAGPDRPVPKPKPTFETGDAELETTDPANAAPGILDNMEKTRSDLYNKLSSAVAERGEMLGDLEQRMNSIGQGSRDMVAQAKRLAAEQGTKRWFGF
ncbi:hypothetical protein HYDPIDRAFT_26582 [Hydnomerulius pinastri MD-312]|nr:hypothetical protein HYDPIDRAFT_26582 [Hydnomerulius pinastri MD-312]